jgi:DegV family protein with EDD domain
MKIALSCESTADLTEELYRKNNIFIVPFSIVLGDKVLLDNEKAGKTIFEYVEKTKILPKTSAVNEEQYREHFNKILGEFDAIVHISLSSTISSAYSNAVKVAKEIGEDKVRVIDSLSLSTGIGLLLLYARKLIDAGESIEDIIKKVEARIPSVQASFVANRLDYLYKGGRCGMLSYYGANLLKIKPEIVVDNGKLKNSKKLFGLFSNTIQKYFDDIMQKFSTPDHENVFITYSTSTKETIESLQNQLKEKGFKNIYPTIAGGTISSHCGPECLGVLFINDGDKR